MLRIRPTSIGLSERDIDLHFHQINLYLTLRRNGYSKKQIQYFYDTQQQIKRDEENEVEAQDSSSQSTSNEIKADNASESSRSDSKYALIVIFQHRVLGYLHHLFHIRNPQFDTVPFFDSHRMLSLWRIPAARRPSQASIINYLNHLNRTR